LDFNSGSSLKQQSDDRYVAPLRYIIVIPSQPVFDGWILNIPTLSWCKLDYLPLNRPRLWHTANLSSEEEIEKQQTPIL
jgi:hypothetical protein